MLGAKLGFCVWFQDRAPIAFTPSLAPFAFASPLAELLEILGSIINGFALPLKEEHKQFLQVLRAVG